MMKATQLLREIEKLEAERQASRAEVATDRVAFARLLGIEPDEWQRHLLRSDAPRVLLNCGRQSGKSTMAAIIALHQALSSPSSLVLILAPAERQAKELFSKVAEAFRTLGHVIPADSYRKMGMELANGSRIEALPGTEKTIRGFSGVDLLLVDEASRVADELYFAVRPMLAVSGGRLMMLSTPYGRRGAFFEGWENGGDEWERYEIPASECPRISPSFLEQERSQMPEWVYRQEYCCEFAETDDQVFTYDMVYGAVDEGVEPLVFAQEAW
jgi:Terminase large subunit, T4likevirus-type, N-terminal